MVEVGQRARPGRQRSQESRTALLRTTSQLLYEVGLRAMTTEAIAGRSGASKATIYKWWPNKYAVAVDAFLSEMMAEPPEPRRDVDPDVAIDLMIGLALYRLMVGHAALSDAAADALVAAAVRGFAGS